MSEDTPQRHLSRQLYRMVFDGHPYGRPVLGTPEIIQKLTRQTLLAFYRRHYVPESFTLVVVGPVNPAEILQAAERTLGRLPRSGVQRLPRSRPAALRPQKPRSPRPGALAYLGMGGSVPSSIMPIRRPSTCWSRSSASALLALGLQALRERLGLVNSVGSVFRPLEAGADPGDGAARGRGSPPRRGRDPERDPSRCATGVWRRRLRRAITRAEAEHAFERDRRRAREGVGLRRDHVEDQ